MSDNSLQSIDSLNPKQRVFLTLLLEGKKVVEAYKGAGYEGEPTAAYMLKSRLDRELVQLAEARGCSKGDLMNEIAGLNHLPVVGKDGEPVTGISMTHKLKVLALQQKVLEMNKAQAPKVTAIQINNYQGDGEPTVTEKAVDAHVIPEA